MSSPRKHHYVPVFYLNQWRSGDGRLCEHKMIPEHGIKARRTFADGTGYQVDLYRIHGLPDDQAQDFEKRFLGMVDTDASRALTKIVSGDKSPWEQRLRSAWTRFILSLVFRNPEAVAVIKGHILQMWDEAIRELEQDYLGRRRPTDPPTFLEYAARMTPHAQHIGASNMLAELIDNNQLGPTIFGMHWSRIDLSGSSIPLLTSDRPIDMPVGLASPDAYIALPVSPGCLFVAAHDGRMAAQLERLKPTDVVRQLNTRIIQQARRYVWGRTDSQLTYIRRNFGSLPDRLLLTDEQRAQAMSAARGTSLAA